MHSLIGKLSLVLFASLTTAGVIGDWQSCFPGDTCASSSFVCCVAPSDETKTTCRPSNDCKTGPTPTGTLPAPTGIANWADCNPLGPKCASSDFICCIAKVDAIPKKYTCRLTGPGSDCLDPTTTSIPKPTHTPLPDGSVCEMKDTCSTSGSKCCRAKKDLTGPHKCRKSAECDDSPMWAGVNSYFMANLPEKEQRYLLSSLQAAGVTKVRIFVTQFGAGGKGTNASATPDLEMTTLGKYDDTALLAIDKLMSLVPEYGIKLIIALHDRWNLDSTWGTCDAYCQAFCKYDKDKKACTSAGGAGTFYTDPTAKKFFDKRLDHIVNHSNKYMRWRPWAQISESIYAFEIQNEGQSTLKMPNPNWWCERATKLKYQLSQNGILISTGGAQYPTDAMIDQNFQCKAIDVVAIHAFSDVAPLIPAVLGKAQNYSKTVIFEEFGAQGQGQAPTIEHTAELSNFYRIPWMPWQVSTVTIPDDFEFSPSDTVTWEVLSRFAKAAQ